MSQMAPTNSIPNPKICCCDLVAKTEQLDNGNNKKAFHEAEKVLKKQKDLTAAKVLKTIALHRMGKEKDAFSLSEEIVALEPTDENSLQGLSLYFKEIRRTELISGIYEAAVKHCPTNEEYLTHLFMSYVRHEKFQQMQRVAMNLYKRHPKNPYLFWAIMSIILQAQYSGNDKLAKTMYLPLASKMIEKHIDNGKIEAEAEVQLYLLILELAGKNEKIIDVLNGPLGEKIVSELRGRENTLLKAQQECEMWQEVNKQYKKLLNENPDVWNYAIGYLESFFKICDRKSMQEKCEENEMELRPVEEADHLLSHVFQFIMHLVKQENSVIEGKKRGPYLLRLEMLKRLKELGDDSQDKIARLGSPWQLILEYALDFSAKPCCFHDLTPYFSLLPEKDVDKFLADLYEQQASFTYNDLNGECSPDLKREINRRKEKELQRHIFTIEATRYLGKHESLWNEEKLALATDYMRRYKNGLQYSNDRPDTDGKVADAYCLFAVRLLLDVYSDTELRYFIQNQCAFLTNPKIEVAELLGLMSGKLPDLRTLLHYANKPQKDLKLKTIFELWYVFCEDLALLWRCVSILEYGLTLSEYNYEMKFMLIRIYCRLGLFTPCKRLYDSLEVKHIQHETLGYTVSHHVVGLGHYDTASLLFQLTSGFYYSSEKECVECLIACFRNGSFYKISELIDFRKTLKNSFHAASIKTEHALMDLFVQLDIHRLSSSVLLSSLNSNRIDFDTLCDSRDFALITDINPENKRITNEMICESFVDEKKFLRFRELLLHSMFLILTQSTKFQQSQNGYSIEKEMLPELDEFLAKLGVFCEECPKKTPSYPFHGPHVSRLHLCFEAQFPQSALLLLKYCKGLFGNVGCDPNEQKDLTQFITSVISNISDFLKTCSEGILVEPKSDDYSNEAGSDTILSQPIPDTLLSLRPGVIERLVLCVEMYSVAVLLITIMKGIVGEVKAEMNRKKKRKKNKQQSTEAPHTCEWVLGYQEGITGLHDLGGCLVAAIKLLKADADSMLLDLAKSRLDKDLTKRRTLSDIPEIPPTIDQHSSENAAVTEKSETEEKSSETTGTLKVPDAADVEDKSDKKSTTESSTDKQCNLNRETELAIKNMQTLNLTEEITATNSAFYNNLEAKSDAQFEKIVRTSSESIRTTCEQLLTIVQGRMKNLNTNPIDLELSEDL